MQRIPIAAQLRKGTGKGPNRRTRAKGLIPSVLYGQNTETVNLAVNEHDFLKAVVKLGGELAMFNLTAEDAGVKEQLVVIREAQRDPVTERIVHLDFLRVDLNKPIDVHLAVHRMGSAVGVREGGVLEQVQRTVHLRCLPDQVPAKFEIDVTNLAIGDAIHVGDLELDEGVQMLSPENFVLFHVVIPRIHEEEEEEEAVGEEVEGEAAEGEEPAEGAKAGEGEKSEA